MILRRPQPADEAAIVGFYTSGRSASGALSEQEAWSRLAFTLGHWAIRGFGRFLGIEKSTGDAILHVGPHRPGGWPEPEIAWSIMVDKAEGKGFAFEGAKAAIAHAFGGLGWKTAVSYIHRENARSLALAERLGATHDAAATSVADDHLVYRHRVPQ